MTRTIPLAPSIAVLSIIILMVAFSIYLGYSVFYALAAGLVLCCWAALKCGFSFREVFGMAKEGVWKVRNIVVILSLIGALIGVWIAGGIVPAMIYYGFKLINLNYFLVTIFIVCSLISMVLGTAIGTVSTVGIAFMGIGAGLGLPLPVVAGAIISGAFLGDRTSPLSSAANLVAAMTETDVSSNLRHLFSTAFPAYMISAFIYIIMGFGIRGGEADLSRAVLLQEIIQENFNLSAFALVPPAIIVTLALLKVKTVYNLIIGIASGISIAVIYQKVSIREVLTALLTGYRASTGVAQANAILSGGGIVVMANMLLVVIAASALSGVLYSTGIISSVMGGFLKGIKEQKGLISKTVLFSLVSAAFGCNQTIAIVLPSQVMRDLYAKLGVSRKTLARTLSDSAILLSPLIPWNVAGLAPSAVLGVEVIKYLPFAFFCYTTPLITLLYGWKGWIIREDCALSPVEAD